MKLAIWLFLCMISSSSFLYTSEGGEVQDIERQITEKESAKAQSDEALKKAAQQAEEAKSAQEQAEKEKNEQLQKPEGQRDQSLIDQLTQEIKKQQGIEEDAQKQVTQETKTNDDLDKEIAALKKEEQQIQQGFTPSGDGTEVSFFSKLILKFKEWSKRLSLAWGVGDVKAVRNDLNDIYQKLGDPFSQAKNTRALAQELPGLTEKIGADLQAIDLLSKTGRTGKDPEVVQEIQNTVVDLVTLRDQLSESLIDKTIRDFVDNKIDQTLKDLGLSQMQIEQLVKQPSQEELATTKELVNKLFNNQTSYDNFKSIRDTVINELQKDPANLEKSNNYQLLMKTITALGLADLMQFPSDEQANISSLIKSTYQDLAQNYNNAAILIGTKPSSTSDDIKTMLELFGKSNDLFEQSQAWDITLQEALDKETQEAKNNPDYQKIVDANKDAVIITQHVADTPKIASDNLVTLKANLEKPAPSQQDFDSFIAKVDEFIKNVNTADPSLKAVSSAAKVAQQLTELIATINAKTEEATLSESILKTLSQWLLTLQNRRSQLLVEENDNQNALIQVLPNNKIVEVPQIEKRNIKSPQAQTSAGQALLKSIQEGVMLRKTSEQQPVTRQQENTITDALAKALEARRKVISGGDDEDGDNGGWD
jgi:hypothetical protein